MKTQVNMGQFQLINTFNFYLSIYYRLNNWIISCFVRVWACILAFRCSVLAFKLGINWDHNIWHHFSRRVSRPSSCLMWANPCDGVNKHMLPNLVQKVQLKNRTSSQTRQLTEILCLKSLEREKNTNKPNKSVGTILLVDWCAVRNICVWYSSSGEVHESAL